MDATFFGSNLALALGAIQSPDYRDLKRAVDRSKTVVLPSGVEVTLNERDELMHVHYGNGTEMATTQSAHGKTIIVRTIEGQYALRRNEGLWFFID